jgi:hypothetical protein
MRGSILQFRCRVQGRQKDLALLEVQVGLGVRLNGRACQDPLIKKLEGILQGAINDVCKCNCQLDSSSGRCPSLPFRPYAPVVDPVIDQCPSSGSNYPSYYPTTRPTYRPPTVSSATWKPVVSPVPLVSSSDEDNSSIIFAQDGDSISDPSSDYFDEESDSSSSDEEDFFNDGGVWDNFDIRRRKRVHSKKRSIISELLFCCS